MGFWTRWTAAPAEIGSTRGRTLICDERGTYTTRRPGDGAPVQGWSARAGRATDIVVLAPDKRPCSEWAAKRESENELKQHRYRTKLATKSDTCGDQDQISKQDKVFPKDENPDIIMMRREPSIWHWWLVPSFFEEVSMRFRGGEEICTSKLHPKQRRGCLSGQLQASWASQIPRPDGHGRFRANSHSFKK